MSVGRLCWWCWCWWSSLISYVRSQNVCPTW
jgi:hypothetical protein